MGKKILSIILSIAIVLSGFPSNVFMMKAHAEEAQYKVEIVSFARGAQADLRSSELLEARLSVSNDGGNTWQVTDNYEGTPVTQLTYIWTNNLDTYLYAYNNHNMYGINDTSGEKSIGTDKSYTGKGFAWAAIYGANISSNSLMGTISVTVKNGNNTIASDSHTGTRTNIGSDKRPTYTYSGILMPDLTDDIAAVSFGLFEGDKKDIKDMLGEAGIVHITCQACSVSNLSVNSNQNHITINNRGVVTANNPGTATVGGDATVNFNISKTNCKFHYYSNGNGNVNVYVYKKPTTTTTATTLTLTNLDSRCTYYIDGVQGRLVKVGNDNDITNDYIIFEGLTPNTDYMVTAKGVTDDTKPVYAYVYDKTKASQTGTIRVLKHTNNNTGGTLTDISDMYTGGKIVFRLNGDLANIETTRVSEGVYSATLSTGTFYPWYTLDGNNYIQGNQQLIVTNSNVESTIHFYEVKYDLNGGSLANNIDSKTYISGEKVTASSATPTRQGYAFIGWKDQYGKMYGPETVITNAITKPYLLEAQWEETVNVYVNVEIDHTAGDGRDYTNTKDDITLRLVYAAEENAPYLQSGDQITIANENNAHSKHDYSFTPDGETNENIEKTIYKANTATFADVPNAFYSIVTDKPGYYIESLENKKEANGDWTINVKMKYAPDSQNLNFAVKVDNAVPENLIPKAAIVKVLFWDKADGKWKIITQQEGMKPGVRVNFSGRTGSGSYPVWTNEPNGEKNPYYYRIVVTSLVYPDGNIVPMKNDVLQDLTQNRTDIYNVAIGNVANGQSIGGLNGAYFVKNGNTTSQTGDLDAVITATGYNVTFDAQGGKVNGDAKQTVTNLYKVPELRGYVPTREGGYVFDGWYKEASCTTPAVEGEYLTGNITLYAKWSEPLKISGNVTVDGTYMLDGNSHIIHDADRAKKVMVLLQKIKGDEVINVASKDVEIAYDSNNKGKGTFLFNGIENNDDKYRIVAYSANYDSLYRNEPATESYSGNKTDYNGTDFNAKFGDDTTAKIDTYLVFNPQSFPLKYEIDATAIGDGYRPTSAEMLVLYDDGLKGNNPLNWAVISQMVQGETLIGEETELQNGKGSANYSVWNQETDGTYYDYAIKLNKYTPANGTEKSFNEDEEPFTVAYNGAARYDASRGQTQTLKAVLTPKEYRVIFDLGFLEDENDNIGKSMEAYRKDEGTYSTTHKWSYETEISATPERAGYEFKGWFIDKDGDKVRDAGEADVTKIEASEHKDVTLTAEWQELPGIYVDVVINHKENEGTGYNNDSDKHNITFTVDQKDAGIGGDFTEIFSKTINWNGSDNVAGYTATYDDSDKQTKYTAAEPTLKAEIDGKSYTVTAAKHGYSVENIESSTVDGKFRLKITLRYDPNNFDFTYAVKLNENAKNLPNDVKPKAVNVKVTSWYDTPYDVDFGAAEGTVNTAWYTITQQRESYQRVALNADGEGTGTYPVWMHETVDGNQVPYYYRIEVVSYELKDGTIVPVNNLAANQPSTSNQYTTASGIYTAIINTDSACVDPDGTGGTELEGAYYGDIGNNNNGQVGSVEAVVSINTYGITLDPAGGKFRGEDGNMTLDQLIQMPDISEYVPTKQGYAFAGWTWKDGENANSVNPLSKGDLMTKNLYLTANWTPISYEIKYVTNGGNLPGNVSDTRTYTITDAVEHPVPTRADYVFKGWYDNSNFNGAAETSFGAGQTGDKVYYAKWEYDNVSLTIHKNFKSGTKADPKQPFIFRIQNSEKGIDLKVCIEGAGYVVVKDLPRSATNYTVTEVTGYSWRYTPDSNTKTVDLSKTNNSVTFTNERTSDNWINAISRKTNRFN